MIVKDLFISYGRRESLGFVGRLHQRLKLIGYDVWFDKVNIPDGDDYVLRINQGIESAHNFIYVMAPRCMTSPHCLIELEYARLLGKRVIPINQMVIFQTEAGELSAIDQETLRNFYAIHGMPDLKIETTQHVLIRSHELIGRTDWLDAKEILDDHDCENLTVWAQSYENFWIKHDELDYLQQFEFPIFGQCIDTLDGAMGRLMLLLEKHSDYVHQHTQILNAALTWQRHQRQVHYLLVGSERLQAEDWLLTDFIEGEQAPCYSTDLQCEFICESRKNNFNVMTQVFICHESADEMIYRNIVQALARRVITTWQPDHDICGGSTLEQAVKRGIEAADNFLHLISFHSIHSEYCNRVLDHALEYHKRIIPILIDPVPLNEIPGKINLLKQIDFTHEIKLDSLIKIINHDKTYYEQHKILLTLALKWDREKKKPSFLLRGHNLSNALLWLRLHQDRYEHPPTKYHRLFIIASEAAKGQFGCEVFISYSRKDSDFARKLNLALQEAGKTTWFDQESISSGVDFAREIFKGIDSSDNFLLILSPDAIESPYCEKEVSYAHSQHKRLIPLLYRVIDVANLPEVFRTIQWLDFVNTPFNERFPDLIQTIELDREHAHQHTIWQQRAIEWDYHQRSNDFLLNSVACQRAEQWLKVAQTERKQPVPTEIQQQHLNSSRIALNARTRRQKRRLIFTNILFTLSLFMGITAIWKWWEASQNLYESQVIQSLFLADLSRQQTEQEQPVEGLLLALEALPHNIERADRPYTVQAAVSLYNALYQLHEEKVLQHKGIVHDVTLSDDEQQVLTASQDGTARIWEMMSGKLLRTLRGHEGPVSQAVFSNDGQWVLTGSWDKTARIWSVTDSERSLVLRGHQDKIHAVAFSHDQQRVLTASADKTVRIWNVIRGEELITLQGHQGSVFQAIFSNDDQRVLTASSDQTARVWSAHDGQLLVTLLGHQGSVYHAAWSPDEQTLLTASADHTARIWSANDGRLLTTLHGHHAPVYDALFDETGERIVTVSADNTARIWEAKSGHLLATLGHEDPVYHAALSLDGQKLVTVSADQTARIWSVNDGQLLVTLRGHQGHIHHVAVGSHRIITAGADQTARIWNVTNPFLLTLREHLGPIHYATLSGTKIATASADGTARLWEGLGENKPIILQGHEGRINQVTFNCDGRKVVTASDDQTAKVWSTEGALLTTLVGHQGPIKRAVFSPDDQRVLTVSRDKTARIWSATDGQLLATLRGHQGTVNDALFSADGQRVFTASDDQTVRIWRASDWRASELLTTLWGHESHIHHLVLSADEQRLLTASDDQTARIWDTRSGNLLFTLRGHEKRVNHVVFSPDGSQVLTASADGTARIWSAISGQLLMILKGHAKGVNQAIFNADGKKVLTASEDNTARLWESASGQPLLILQGHRGPVYRAQFSNDEQWILTASQDGTARVWRIFETIQTLIDQANLLKPRVLTTEQRKQFFLPTIDENENSSEIPKFY